MFPIITNLTNSLKLVDNLHEEYEEPDDNTIISDTEENLTNQSTGIDYNNISEVLKNVKKIYIYRLKHYWSMLDEFGIMAALLDPQYKDLNFISDENIKVKIHSSLQIQYDQLKREMQQQIVLHHHPQLHQFQQFQLILVEVQLPVQDLYMNIERCVKNQ
ncbi:hypothetical protein RirG_071770 [Rhizophagus irregularis DAOM 197198w]|uniref:Uncharacterized protein n=1 Tax=Rhizophagus irregularis (strain DAOM 197198w) TaxID=1432141 RepID=A0A015JRL7_RHIIW|nr:hypothetical protein RirG_071770 [Rhizophagus irregularis DAOM 197198w]